MCAAIGPRRDEHVPNTKVLFFSSRRADPLVPNCVITQKSSLCNVIYRYSGFERRRTSFSVASTCKSITFGAEEKDTWVVDQMLLSPPDIKRGEHYFFALLSRSIQPSNSARSGEGDNLIYSTDIPVNSTTKPIELSISVTIS
jgi:hypothetical protein